MDIIIAGAGTVGYSLAQTLSYKHNVTVIDKNRQKLEKLEEDVDLMTIIGDVENPKTYQKLDLSHTDLFIAVTDSDEANLLSTLIVEDVVTVEKKIIRLKNDGFLTSHVLEKLSIDYAVFPDIATANKVKALLGFPRANNVKMFHQTRFVLASVRVRYKREEAYRMEELNSKDIRIVGVEREKTFFVPDVSESIRQNDLIYLFGSNDAIERMTEKLDDTMPETIKKVVIFGANTLARKIAKALLSKHLEIKMIEKDLERCRIASQYLEGRVRVIHSSHEDERLFEEEGLRNADMLISALPNDETNIIKCFEAQEYGIAKVVAINNDKAYYDLMHKMGIIVVRGSKAGAHFAILEKIASSAVVTQRHFCGGRGVMFLRKIYAGSALIGKEVGRSGLDGTMEMLLREEHLLDIEAAGCVNEEDIIVVFGTVEEKEVIAQWIYGL